MIESGEDMEKLFERGVCGRKDEKRRILMCLETGSRGKALSVLMGVSWGAGVSVERRDPEDWTIIGS